MLSDNKEFSFDSICSVLNDIQNETDQSNDRFIFDDFKYELCKNQYENKTRYESVMHINDWIETVPYHTFPKTKIGWINAIMTQPYLRTITINYKLKDIVTDLYLKQRLPIHILNFYNRIYNNPAIDKTTEQSIICHMNAIDIFDNMIELKLVRVEGKRVYINKYTLERNIKSFHKRPICDITGDDDVSGDGNITGDGDVSGDGDDCVMSYKRVRLL
jgi:hypothetical protein